MHGLIQHRVFCTLVLALKSVDMSLFLGTGPITSWIVLSLFGERLLRTSKSKYKPADYAEVKGRFLTDMVSVVTMEEILTELMLNWDQTGIHLVPVSPWTMDQAGSKRVGISCISSKQQITTIFFVAPLSATFYQCSWSTKERCLAVIHLLISQMAGMWLTLLVIGLQKRPWCSTLRRLPYSWKFSRSKNLADGLSWRISRVKFSRIGTSDCHTHNAYLNFLG